MFHSLPKSYQIIWVALVTTIDIGRFTAVLAEIKTCATLLTTVQLTPVCTDRLLAGLFVLLECVCETRLVLFALSKSSLI